MTLSLKSRTVSLSKTPAEVYDHFVALENYEKIMPESIEKFELDGSSFLFVLKGMPEIRLVLKEKTPSTQIVLGAASSKLDFALTLSIEETPSHNAEVNLLFEGEFTPMMNLMVKKPLTNFINTLADQMEALYGN